MFSFVGLIALVGSFLSALTKDLGGCDIDVFLYGLTPEQVRVLKRLPASVLWFAAVSVLSLVVC